MSYIMIDIEADWPCPWLYSMVSFGAVVVEGNLKRTFYWELKPISEYYIPEALNVSWFTREETEQFDEPEYVMKKFAEWVDKNSAWTPIFVADNLAFDWQFINYYFHKYLEYNPFNHSWINMGDLYAWMEKSMSQKWRWQKKYRITKHTHNPVDDAKWNAEALLAFQQLGLDIKLI